MNMDIDILGDLQQDLGFLLDKGGELEKKGKGSNHLVVSFADLIKRAMDSYIIIESTGEVRFLDKALNNYIRSIKSAIRLHISSLRSKSYPGFREEVEGTGSVYLEKDDQAKLVKLLNTPEWVLATVVKLHRVEQKQNEVRLDRSKTAEKQNLRNARRDIRGGEYSKRIRDMIGEKIRSYGDEKFEERKKELGELYNILENERAIELAAMDKLSAADSTQRKSGMYSNKSLLGQKYLLKQKYDDALQTVSKAFDRLTRLMDENSRVVGSALRCNGTKDYIEVENAIQDDFLAGNNGESKQKISDFVNHVAEEGLMVDISDRHSYENAWRQHLEANGQLVQSWENETGEIQNRNQLAREMRTSEMERTQSELQKMRDILSDFHDITQGTFECASLRIREESVQPDTGNAIEFSECLDRLKGFTWVFDQLISESYVDIRVALEVKLELQLRRIDLEDGQGQNSAEDQGSWSRLLKNHVISEVERIGQVVESKCRGVSDSEQWRKFKDNYKTSLSGLNDLRTPAHRTSAQNLGFIPESDAKGCFFVKPTSETRGGEFLGGGKN